MKNERVFKMTFASIYPLYIQKVERKGQDKSQVDEAICWLTGYNNAGLAIQIENEVDLETFFANAPQINPNTALIKGVICGVRVEEIEDPLMQKIRWMDKIVDDIAKGRLAKCTYYVQS